MKRIFLLILILWLLTACGETSAGSSNELLISSASSLSEVMEAAEAEFNKIHPEIKLVFNFSSSGKLSNQIQQGAPVDLFLSASTKDMETLVDKGHIHNETIKDFAENKLVLASGNQSDEAEMKKLLVESDQMIAIGEPESVPLGAYTKEILMEQDLWEPLKDRLIFAKDARQVLSYVESGNTEMGIVYASDVLRSKGIQTTVSIEKEGQKIVYPGGIVEGSKNSQAAEAFLAFLTSSQGQKLLSDYGFIPIEGNVQ